MITILCGPEAALLQYCDRLCSSFQNSLLLPPSNVAGGKIFVRHNANLRELLAKLRPLLGNQRFEQIVLRHKVAASFLLSHLQESLSVEEREEASRFATSLASNTSHNWFTSSFLSDAWSRLFADLVDGVNVVWVMPDFQSMGPGFIEMVRRLLIHHRPDRLQVVLGFKTEKRDLSRDENGIAWDYLPIRNLRNSFSVFEDASVLELPAADTLEAGRHDDRLLVDSWDRNRDDEIFLALSDETSPGSLLEEGCLVLEQAFGAYDFRAALQLGLQMLRHEKEMSNPQKALVHATVGISAHNRQFSSSKGNESFNAFLEYHFGQALEYETDIARRSTVSYRLATTIARRGKRAEAAIACVNRSLEELRLALEPSRRRAYYEAWLLNIRAYAHMLVRDYRQSAADVEGAFNLAEASWNHSEDPTPDEIYSAQLFAGNRATLALYGHDDEQLDVWFSKGTGLFEKYWGVGKRYVRYLRLELAKRKLDLEAAVTAGEEGLSDAIIERSAEYQDLYRMNLADLYYRRGELEQVFAHLRDALEMYKKLGEERRRFTALMFLAEAEARIANFKAADGLYRRALESQSGVGPAASADLLSARGLLAARQGLSEEASNLLDEAISAAIESSERGALLLVARRAGDAFLEFGDREQATDAYQRALEIATVASPEGAPEPHPGDLTRIWIGLYECESHPEHLEKALRGLPIALELESALWWELPRILRLLLRATPSTDLLERNRPEIELLLRAARQRRDTRELASRLAKKLEIQPVVPPGVQVGDVAVGSL